MSDIKGCGSHSCRFKKPTGMATNGPCQCYNNPETMKLVVNDLQQQLSDANELVSLYKEAYESKLTEHDAIKRALEQANDLPDAM